MTNRGESSLRVDRYAFISALKISMVRRHRFERYRKEQEAPAPLVGTGKFAYIRAT
jgi:hypothetical protein